MTTLADNTIFGIFVSSMLLIMLTRNCEASSNVVHGLSKNRAIETKRSLTPPGYSFKTLTKRSTIVSHAAVKGLRAAKYLLRGSKRVGQGQKLFNDKINEFRKAGGYEQATADFRTIKPINVKEWGSPGLAMTSGRVGNREIVLHRKGFFETGMVEIIKWHGTSKKHVDVIHYY